MFDIDWRHCENCTPYLDLNFQGETFEGAILTSKRWRKCKHYYCHQIGSQAFAIEWRHCECCMSCVQQKCFSTIFIEVDIWNRIGPLGMLYFTTLI